MTLEKTNYSSWQTLTNDFQKFHANSLNVFLHLITTPAGIYFFLGFLQFYNLPVQVIAGVYTVLCLVIVPVHLTLLTGFSLYGMCLMLEMLESFDLKFLIGGMGIAFVAQDAAHYLTNEPTFLSTYTGKPMMELLSTFFLHTVLLIPLVYDSAWHTNFASWLVPRDRVVYVELNDKESLKDLDQVKDWVEEQNPSHQHTTHMWYSDLPPERVQKPLDRMMKSQKVRESFEKVFDPQTYGLEILPLMNEIYIASFITMQDPSNTSDKVFYTKHVDGPFFIYPFASVYRVLFAISENELIRTKFPLSHPEGMTLNKGGVLGFDFNRELHLIELNDIQDTSHFPSHRIVLKAHYLVYPKSMWLYGQVLGYLTSFYDILARKLFLYTLTPKNLNEQFAGANVIQVTKLAALVCEYIGFPNFMYVFVMAAASYYLNEPRVFLYATSFIHYLMYMATYYTRGNVDYGAFLRGAIFFKTISLGQLFYLYYVHFTYDLMSIAMIVVGYAIAFQAFQVLGLERTYFGVELGILKPKRLSAFPYNCIPHPMMVGAMTALAGFAKNSAFQAANPYVIPLHIGCYFLHMIQEQFDIHCN